MARFKPVPEAPDDVETIGEVRRALPLVPGSEDDCCARVMERAGITPRDEARTWITFLRALGLVERHDAGFARTREDVGRETLAGRFESNVYLADAVLGAVREGDGSLSAEAVFEAVADEVPRWERDKSPDWRREWRDRVGRLLAWATLLGLLERTDGGYRPA